MHYWFLGANLLRKLVNTSSSLHSFTDQVESNCFHLSACAMGFLFYQYKQHIKVSIFVFNTFLEKNALIKFSQYILEIVICFISILKTFISIIFLISIKTFSIKIVFNFDWISLPQCNIVNRILEQAPEHVDLLLQSIFFVCVFYMFNTVILIYPIRLIIWFGYIRVGLSLSLIAFIKLHNAFHSLFFVYVRFLSYKLICFIGVGSI